MTPKTGVPWKGVIAITLFCSSALQSAEVSRSTGTIAKGTRWEAPFYIVDSGVAGPTVVLTGGIHGNEPAGARAAEQICSWPIVRGKLVVVPRCNIPGLLAKTRFMPKMPDGLGDLNRAFKIPKEKSEVSTQGELATALWQFVVEQEPDWVIDLHEGYEFYATHKPPKGKKRSVGSTIIYSANKTVTPLVERALQAANMHVTDPKRNFRALKRGPVAGSLARAADVQLGATTMILETTFKNQPISLRTRQHRAMVSSLLNDIGLVTRDCSHLLVGKTNELIDVGIFDGSGTGPLGKKHLPRIADDAPQIAVHFLGPAELKPETLKQFDVLLFPGGSGSKQARAIGPEGRKHVRQFVRDGGGYLGVCAGAYLCSAHYSWSLNLIDSSVFTGAREIKGVGRKQMWFRGNGKQVDVELSEAGKKFFSKVPTRFKVLYYNGPIISPKHDPKLDAYEVLAWYRSEQVKWEPQRGTMINTPAIVRGRFGDGRVVSISPHPEASKSLEPIIVDLLRWAAKQ